MDISFLLFPNLLPQAQNFPLHLGVRQDQFHSIIHHQFLFPEEDNMPLSLLSFFSTSILPISFFLEFLRSFFHYIILSTQKFRQKEDPQFLDCRPSFSALWETGTGSPAGIPYHVGVGGTTKNQRSGIVEIFVFKTVGSDIRSQRRRGVPQARPSLASQRVCFYCHKSTQYQVIFFTFSLINVTIALKGDDFYVRNKDLKSSCRCESEASGRIDFF